MKPVAPALLLAGLTSLMSLMPAAHAQTSVPAATSPDVIRHRPAGSTFPIASAVEVPAGRTLVFVSGAVPAVADPKAERGSLAAYGDTRTQTLSVLANIERQLKGLGLGMGSVVKMQVFLVGDPAIIVLEGILSIPDGPHQTRIIKLAGGLDNTVTVDLQTETWV